MKCTRRIHQFAYIVDQSVADKIDSLEAGRKYTHHMIDKLYDKKEQELIHEAYKKLRLG